LVVITSIHISDHELHQQLEALRNKLEEPQNSRYKNAEWGAEASLPVIQTLTLLNT